MEGFSADHGIVCVACKVFISAGEKIVAVYEAHQARDFFFGRSYVKGSAQGFPLFVHLNCPAQEDRS